MLDGRDEDVSMTTGAVDPLVLGQRIKHFRRRSGMTLDQLGGIVGRPAPYLSLVENGKREPRIGLINDLAAALGVPAVDLLVNEPPTRRAERKASDSTPTTSRNESAPARAVSPARPTISSWLSAG